MSILPGAAKLSASWRTMAQGDSADAEAAALLGTEVLACFGWRWPSADRRGDQVVELRPTRRDPRAPRLFNEQGYRLTITPRRIVIEGATSLGRSYGVQTLRQILRGSPTGKLPCLRIADYPALEWRGISDDVSRGQIPTPADVEATIRQLAYYKINLYQLYLEDAVAFDAAAAAHGGGGLTRADLQDIVAAGRRSHVVVCPILQTLGHQEHLRALEQKMGGSAAVARPPLSPWDHLAGLVRDGLTKLVVPSSTEMAAPALSLDDPNALPFVQGLIDSVAAVTPGPFFHVGGDEWATLNELPPSDSLGRRQAARAYGRFVGALARHLSDRYQRRTMLYGDVLLGEREAAEALPRDIIVVDWHYDPVDSFPSLGRLRALGFRDIVVSPGLWTWNTFYPNYAWAFRNVAAFTTAGKRAGALGSVASSWGDNGAENLRENNWAGYAYSAAAAWEPVTPAADPFLRRFVVTQYGVDSEAMAEAEKLLGWQVFEQAGWAGRLFHRPPLVRSRPTAWVGRMQALRSDMQKVESDLAVAGSSVRFNRDHLAVARHCAARFVYIAERELLLDSLGRNLQGRDVSRLPSSERRRVENQLTALQSTAGALSSEFSALWLRRNRPAGLAEDLAGMDRQATMLGRLARRCESGRLAVDSTYSGMQALNDGP
jgi:hypothetical protein